MFMGCNSVREHSSSSWTPTFHIMSAILDFADRAQADSVFHSQNSYRNSSSERPFLHLLPDEVFPAWLPSISASKEVIISTDIDNQATKASQSRYRHWNPILLTSFPSSFFYSPENRSRARWSIRLGPEAETSLEGRQFLGRYSLTAGRDGSDGQF